MAKAKNAVIAGDYQGWVVVSGFNSVSIGHFRERRKLDRSEVKSYELITDEHRKSAASGIARGLVGGALLGPIGAFAGSMSAKSKGIYQIAIEFNDGKRSLLEVDDFVYKQIVKDCF